MVITKDGIPLFMKSDEKFPDNSLVSCFLSAIQSFAAELNNSCIDKIEMQPNTFYYSAKGPIFSICVAEQEDEIDSRIYKITAERISRAFLEKFPEQKIEEQKGIQDYFEDFSKDYETITNDIQKLQKQTSKDFILKYFSEAASNENIVGMIVFDLKKDEIIASDIPADISEKSFESFSSMLFNFLDRLGNELKSGKINEMLLRSKEYWIGGFRKGDMAVFTIFSHDFFGNIIPDFITSTID
jgi:predicted regulator of Ras-like GTPase activity (Roadblock/LC7/MglB family)